LKGFSDTTWANAIAATTLLRVEERCDAPSTEKDMREKSDGDKEEE
jgi:hypothetical protein